MFQHTPRPRPSASRTLRRAGLSLTAAGAVLAAGAGPAAAVSDGHPAATLSTLGAAGTQAVTNAAGTAMGTLHSATAAGLGAAKDAELNPLAETGTNPLDNAVTTRVADFEEVSTEPLTEELADGGALRELPVVGKLLAALPG